MLVVGEPQLTNIREAHRRRDLPVLVHHHLGVRSGKTTPSATKAPSSMLRLAEVAAVGPAVARRGDTVVIQPGATAPGRSSVVHALKNAVVPELPDETALKPWG